MEDNINHDEFEEFLQDQVKNHRMYPSDAVWREIDKNLHGEKRWPALTIAATSLVSITVLICVYFTPKTDIFSIPTITKNSSSQKANILNDLNANVPFSTRANTPVNAGSEESGDSKASASLAKPVIGSARSNDASKNAINRVVSTSYTVSAPTPKSNVPGVSAFRKSDSQNPSIQSENTFLNEDTETALGTKTIVTHADTQMVREKISSFVNIQDKETVYKKPTSGVGDNTSDVPVYSARKRAYSKSKFSYQVYAAPSVSYRKLLEDNSVGKENIGGPVGINYITDVNKVVRHKPGTGIEAGVSFMYNVSSKVRIKSGFQFNIRQYSIEAYRSNTELASIALTGNNRLDTINTLAIYRTNNGYYSTKLVNRYYQLSMPMGIEWEVMGNRLIQLNVAGSIQPTYLLNRNAYLLTTNFKNYTESPGMVRQWNLNSNIEAFISVKSGDFKWQLGPQLRYQPYSTFIPEYSIKEHLLDYGVKLGVSKSIH